MGGYLALPIPKVVLLFRCAAAACAGSFLSNSNAFRLRDLVSQKGQINRVILKHLILLFQTGRLRLASLMQGPLF